MLLRKLALMFALLSVLPLAGCESKEHKHKEAVELYNAERQVYDRMKEETEQHREDMVTLQAAYEEALGKGWLDPKSKHFRERTAKIFADHEKEHAKSVKFQEEMDAKLEAQFNAAKKAHERADATR